MRVYKKLTLITTLLAGFAFAMATILHYCFSCAEADFWVNVCLGIFGSAILTALTSVVSYHHEKRKTLEGFVYHTRQIISHLNKYQESMTLEEKLRFFLDYKDLDKSAWDMDFGDMDFFLECHHHNRKYIYEKIYKPISDFNEVVNNHVWHFRWHLDGSGKNDVVMQTFIKELESYLLEKHEQNIPTEYDENGTPISFFHCSGTSSKLVTNIIEELGGHYYEVMYGKKIANREMKSQEEETNG